jgi:hypothetical protein
MIANILFFIGYTILVFILASRRVKELVDILHKQEERYDDCVKKLKLRSEQNDTLLQVIDELNKKLRDKQD